MKILAISENYPFWDRSSGDYRYFQLLKILANKYEVYLCPYSSIYEIQNVGKEETERYRKSIEEIGVHVLDGGIIPILKQQKFDLVIFEFYIAAQDCLDDVRYYQPEAITIVDSVDIHFRRLYNKANLTKDQNDYVAADDIKHIELDVYSKADGVIVVTNEDREALLHELPQMPTFVCPNIHSMPKVDDDLNIDRNTLIFIGSFKHSPNVDAMLYFCEEVLPIIVRRYPDVELRIIGSAVTPEINALESTNVNIVGFVPETGSWLRKSYISIAPLRYGAGIKGKIGEAMSYRLPVVTTPTGVDGYGLTPYENVLVGESPDELANLICELIENSELYEKIANGGYHFIKETFSDNALEESIYTLVDKDICNLIPKDIPIMQRLLRDFLTWGERTLFWRFSMRN